MFVDQVERETADRLVDDFVDPFGLRCHEVVFVADWRRHYARPHEVDPRTFLLALQVVEGVAVAAEEDWAVEEVPGPY